QARACLEESFNQGINFIDTANVYGRGAAEKFLGDALRGRPRDSYVLATKVYFPMSETDRGLSRAQIEKQLDASLKRLRTDYVDLYQCHRYDWDTPLEETLEALTRAVESGRARAIGFSEWPAERIQAALDLAGSGHAAKFVSSQPQYSLLWREPEEMVIPLCAANGISQIVWSPLGQGVLSGKYDPERSPPSDSRAASKEMGGFINRFLKPEILRAVQRLKPIAEEAGLTLPQFALAWVLREPNVASAIIGASRPQQIRENAAASGVVVDTQLFVRAEQIIDEARESVEA
ncbi:MAG TPA: aldo/keto reductase, partial [Sphingomicrobium sp.]|nr:aldo/keto reductase [Sphingomicrobium sp.]